ncbi:MAG: hypothetical protein KDA44_13810 [Planctomycetales bacterium]|nr:hypothetical protein [Planctomycetales bacterium]
MIALVPSALADVVGEGDVSPQGPVDLPIDGGTATGGTVPGDVIVGGTAATPAQAVDPSLFGRLTIDIPAFTDPLVCENGIIAGNTPDSIGVATVAGFLSQWTVNVSMQVGQFGFGTLDIIDGAIVDTSGVGTVNLTDDAQVGVEAESQGFVNISGLGSRWSHDDLLVGLAGFGVVTVENGGRLVTTGNALLGETYNLTGSNNEIGNGRVSVSGIGSRWVVGSDAPGSSDELIVGEAGIGEIEALDEGVIRVIDSVTLANSSTAYGKARVNGRGSLIWTFETLFVAGATGSRADLYVEDEGIARADTRLTVGTRGFVNLAGGTVLTPAITNNGVIRGDGVLDTGDTGQVINNGDLRVAASIANIRERMLVTGPVDNTQGVIEAIGGEIEFLGSVTGGDIVNEDGIIRFDGGFALAATSLVSMTLSSDPGGIFAPGGASLSGDLNVAFVADYVPQTSESFTLISGGPVTGTFTTENVPTNWEVVYLPDSVILQNVVAPPVFAGSDFDLDGDVDGVDLAAWQSGFGTSPGALKSDGDANGDGAVNGRDFLSWQREYGFTSSPTAATVAAVPEPGAAALAILALGGLAMRRRGA